jgi:hypothetical protein
MDITELRDAQYLRRSRGVEANDVETAMMQVKELTSGLSSSLHSVRAMAAGGNTESAGAQLKTAFGNANSLIEVLSKETEHTARFDGSPGSLNIRSSSEDLSLESVPDSVLGDSIPPNSLDSLASFSSVLADAWGRIDQSSHVKSAARKKQSPGSTGGISFQDIVHKHMKGLSFPQVRNFYSGREYEVIMAEHRLRQDALGVCEQRCTVNDLKCNCGKLFDCVDSMAEFDLLVLSAKGYIDTTISSVTHGEFTVQASELKLYNVEEDLRGKLSRVKGLVAQSDRTNRADCDSVLQEFHSAW